MQRTASLPGLAGDREGAGPRKGEREVRSKCGAERDGCAAAPGGETRGGAAEEHAACTHDGR